MSMVTTGTCPHGRGVFAWLGDGPWLGDEGDPDYGRYPYVHDSTMIPGHLVVCELMPFATAEEAGEVCACGHETRSHPPSGPVPDAPAVAARARPCLDCGCDDFRHRAGDLARQRRPAEAAAGDEDEERLMRGEAVPGARGACSREGCAHSAICHRNYRSARSPRVTPCRRCRCPGWTDEDGALMPREPDEQLALFGGGAA